MSSSSISAISDIQHYFKNNQGYDYYKRQGSRSRTKRRHRRHGCCGNDSFSSIIKSSRHFHRESCSRSRSRHHRHHKHHKS